MLFDMVMFITAIVVLYDITMKFLEQFAPDNFVYKAKHKKRPLKKILTLIGGDDQ